MMCLSTTGVFTPNHGETRQKIQPNYMCTNQTTKQDLFLNQQPMKNHKFWAIILLVNTNQKIFAEKALKDLSEVVIR